MRGKELLAIVYLPWIDKARLEVDPTTPKRRTFAGFTTRTSENVKQCETRGRFVIERGMEEGDNLLTTPTDSVTQEYPIRCRRIEDFKRIESFSEFIQKDRLRRKRRKRLLTLARYYENVDEESLTSWSHLGLPQPRYQPKVEPTIFKTGQPRRLTEFLSFEEGQGVAGGSSGSGREGTVPFNQQNSNATTNANGTTSNLGGNPNFTLYQKHGQNSNSCTPQNTFNPPIAIANVNSLTRRAITSLLTIRKKTLDAPCTAKLYGLHNMLVRCTQLYSVSSSGSKGNSSLPITTCCFWPIFTIGRN